ncbi:MAG: IS200/IS605 family transposase [Paludibacteraceae bacterium]|nr:IS200/IS605 family transposase [Paludibacteraceae bacterium]
MANTYTQIHIHCVFAVKRRKAMIDSAFKEELYEYITGIVQQRGHKMLAIGGTSNHIHIFLGLNVDESVSDLMQAVKRNSSLWINQNHKTQNRFEWQKGYGAFSYSKSHVNAVINYIKRQEEHHRKKAFREEYKQILRNFDVKYDERYLLQDV